MRIFKLCLLLLIGNSAHAAILRNLDAKHVIEVTISQKGLTRIAVEEDRILSVFGLAHEYALEADEDQGQIFIRPEVQYEGGKAGFKPIHLTLTTEEGRTQDLTLIPKEKAPETLILQVQEDKQKKDKKTNSPIVRDNVENLLLAAYEGRIPLGYKSIPLDLKTLRGSYPVIQEIRGENLKCLVYEVHNQNNKIPLILKEEVFLTPQVVAVSIPHKILKFKEGTKVYVVSKVFE